MKSHNKYLLTLFCALLVCAVYTKLSFSQEWQLLPHSPAQEHINFFAIHPEIPNHYFIGSDGNLFNSANQGKDWRQVFNLSAGAKVNEIYFDKNKMFLLTSEGLFLSVDTGATWKKIFSGHNKKEQNVLCMDEHPVNRNVLYIGTESGIFETSDAGKTWNSMNHELSNEKISDIKTNYSDNEIFMIAGKSLYRFRPQSHELKQIYQFSNVAETSEEDAVENTEEPVESQLLNEMTSLLAPSSSMTFLGTNIGVFFSDDEGNHWQRLPQQGLLSRHITNLAYAQSSKHLFAATDKGVFMYDFKEKNWHELYEGMPQNYVKSLELDEDLNKLYAATEKGLYEYVIHVPDSVAIESPNLDQYSLLMELTQLEPSIRTLQNEAIKYANVKNSKTKKWQYASRIRALIPYFSVSKGLSVSTNTASSSGKFYSGPDDMGKDLDLNLNWDLGDLLFNSSQTSINSQEKYMVELRENILNEITRLYFERRRTQTEYVLKKPEGVMEQMNTTLRIDELTANIDALTNGSLSKSLNDLYRSRPEFYELWKVEESST